MILVVALTLTTSVVIVSRVLLTRVDSRMAEEITHEGEKLRAFATTALDPTTGVAYRSVDDLLAAYLRTNIPNANETFFSVVDGRAAHRSPYPPPARLDLDAALVRRVAAAGEPISMTIESNAGPVVLGVFPLRLVGDSRPAALAVGQFARGPQQEAWDVIRILIVVSLLALLAAALVSWFVAGRVLAPIRLVRRTAQQISESDFSRRIEVSGTDDVAALAATFNDMLDRLQSAFATQRQFLNDAGHELRTPLTVIRGHLELMDEDPDERRETLAIVIDEIERMNRLVDDLTVLAQTDEPDFLHPGPVNPAHVVIEAVAKARALGDRRWVVDEACDAQVLADDHRLTQALMQLITNAVAHTSDGDLIGVGAALDGDRLLLWVRDRGSGIAETDVDRIFDRFVRGTNDGSSPGRGLGLSIVESIARAHGGRVRLENHPGQGATFTLDLPVRSALEPVT